MNIFLHLDIQKAVKITLLFWVFLFFTTKLQAQESLQLQVANAKYQSGEYAEAARYYENILKQSPQTGLAFRRYISSLNKQGQPERLERFLSEQITRYPRIAQYQIELARLHYQTQKPELGQSLLLKLCRTTPLISVYRLALDMLGQEIEHKHRIVLIENARQVLKNSTLFAYELGESFLFVEAYDSATRAFVMALVKEPYKYPSIERQIKSYVSTDTPKRLSLVISELTKAQATAEQVSRKALLRFLASLSEDSKQYQQALKYYVALDKISKAKGRLVFQFAERQRIRKNHPLAIMAYKQMGTLAGQKQYLDEANYWLAILNLEEAQRGYIGKDEISGVLFTAEQIALSFENTNKRYKIYLEMAKVLATHTSLKDSALQVLKRLDTHQDNTSLRNQADMLRSDILFHQLRLGEAKPILLELLPRLSHSQEGYSRVQWLLAQIYFFDLQFTKSLGLLKQVVHKSKTSNNAIELRMFILEGLADTLANPNLKMALGEAVAFFKPHDPEQVPRLIDQMDRWLNAYPFSSLADNIMFRQALLAEKTNPGQAFAIYSELFKRYSDSYYADQAFYKQAWLQDTYLNNRKLAVELYQVFLKKYPKSIYSNQVRKRLVELLNVTS